MSSWFFHVLSLLSLLTVACGDAGDGFGGSGGSGGNPTTGVGGAQASGGEGGQGAAGGDGGGVVDPGSIEADYCSPLAEFICTQAESCDCGSILPGGNLDIAACIAAYTSKCLDAYAQITQAVEDGLAEIDGARALACVELLVAATPDCERPRGAIPLALCEAWFYSDTAVGDPCMFPLCDSGAGHCVEGTCVPRPGQDEPCNSYECQAGLLCLDGACALPGAAGDTCSLDDACSPPLRCIEGACAALGGMGEACGDSLACAHGLRCFEGECSALPPPPCEGEGSCGNLSSCVNVPVCLPRAAAGALCASSDACAATLYCDDTGVCVDLPAAGEDCVNGVMCGLGLGCTTENGTCVAAPGEGEACAFSQMGPSVCADGLGCDSTTNQCAALPIEGESCTVDNRCGGDLGCDFTPNGSLCVQRKPAGGACQNDLVCLAGFHCDFTVGSCAEDYPLGQSCSSGNECGPVAQCLPGNGGDFVCSAAPSAGEPCLFECPDPAQYCGSQPANAACLSAICLEL